MWILYEQVGMEESRYSKQVGMEEKVYHLQ